MQQLRSDIWCASFVRRHNDRGALCVVVRRGDPAAGQIFIEIDHLDGTASLLMPAPGPSEDAGRRFQLRFDRVEPPLVADRIRREADFDPDLWHLALDSRSGEHGADLVTP